MAKASSSQIVKNRRATDCWRMMWVATGTGAMQLSLTMTEGLNGSGNWLQTW